MSRTNFWRRGEVANTGVCPAAKCWLGSQVGEKVNVFTFSRVAILLFDNNATRVSKFHKVKF